MYVDPTFFPPEQLREIENRKAKKPLQKDKETINKEDRQKVD